MRAILLFCVLLISCRSTNLSKLENVNVIIYKREKYDLPVLVIKNLYEFKGKQTRLAAFVEINRIVFYKEIKDWEKDIVITLRPDHYDVIIASFGMETIELKNLKIKDRDSIVITAVLKDSLEPLYDK